MTKAVAYAGDIPRSRVAPNTRPLARIPVRMSAKQASEQLRTSLPREVARRFRPHAQELARAVLTGIRQSSPEYATTLDGPLAEIVVGATHSIVLRVIDGMVDPHAPRDDWPSFARGIGKIECEQGRSLDALHAAYRAVAEVTTAHLTRFARNYGVSIDSVRTLATAIAAHCDELCEQSAQGYASTQPVASAATRRHREQLLQLILDDTRCDPRAVADEARCARWDLPEAITVVALRPPSGDGKPAAVDLGYTVLANLDGAHPCLVAASDDPILDRLGSALPGWRAAVGPSVPLTGASASVRVARRALDLVDRGLIPREPAVIDYADHRRKLMLFADDFLIDHLVERQLAPLRTLTEAKRHRMLVTLQQWLATRGQAAEIAARLNVHTQTVRYRVNQLQQLFGEQLADPQSRFALAMATRVALLRSAATDTGD